MKLEEAVTLIENVQEHRDRTSRCLDYWYQVLHPDPSLRAVGFYHDTQGVLGKRLDDFVVRHHNLYATVEQLRACAASGPPNPSDYGENARQWSRAEKGAQYSILAFVCSVGGAITSGIATNAGFPFRVAAALLGVSGVIGLYCKYKCEIVETKRDVVAYLQDIVAYKRRINYLSSPEAMQSLKKSINKYVASLRKLASDFEVIDDQSIQDLIDNCGMLERFRDNLSDVAYAIRKKSSVSLWGRIFAPTALISAGLQFEVQSVENQLRHYTEARRPEL
jgi:hypothetical protein